MSPVHGDRPRSGGDGVGEVETAAVAAMAAPARLVRTEDFEAVLRAPIRARTSHFALHHLAAIAEPAPGPGPDDLSTGAVETEVKPVEDLPDATSRTALGLVVPKRHARRAVTRSLLKRQIREAARRHGARLAPGLWIVRLRAPFDRAIFRSAASEPLKRAARGELDQLLGGRPSPAPGLAT